MFADNEINPSYFSRDAIYDANQVFQNYDKIDFGKHLYKMAQNVIKAIGKEHWIDDKF